MKTKLRALSDTVVDFAGRFPFTVLLVAFAMLVSCWSYARKLEVRSDIMELLPKDSPGLCAFERRVERAGGRATLVVVVESPERKANERFADALEEKLEALKAARPDLISFVESGTHELRAFFDKNRWLYAELKDLEEADSTLDKQIAVQSGMVEDLESEGTPERAFGMDKFRERWKNAAAEKDDFPTGYFASKDGLQIALRIMATGSGMGASSDEHLMHEVDSIIKSLGPSRYHAAMRVGLGGDIANATAEKESLVREAIVATAIAAILILGGVVWFYRSLWSLVLVGVPPLLGVGCAYAFATFTYGFVNASGAFLGAIILGNGVNYPIVLYSRYREFRARGMEPVLARREAVVNAFRAELVGATVASIAYGSLTVTRFRGFSQFGVIGFVGMMLVWISMVPCVPALIVLLERLQPHLPAFLRERPERLAADESRGPVARLIGNATERYAPYVIFAAIGLTAIAAYRLPTFLRDPWEYNFDKLGSKGSRASGPAEWSAKSDVILSGRMNLAGSMILADRPEQVAEVKAKILENDAADPRGSLIESIRTIGDFLPEAQDEKLTVLQRIRDRLTPGVMARLSEAEQADLRSMIPPETLGPVTAKDLPSLLRHRFEERDGTLGTILYISYKPHVSTNDGHDLLRMASAISGVRLADGTPVDMASRATVFAEMIKSLERDGPLATGVSFLAVVVVVIVATSSIRGGVGVVLSLLLGVGWMMGAAALSGERLNFLNFIALPITFGIGSEYPFNIFDRSRLLGGDVTRAVKLHLGTVALCSYTTIVGYGSLIFADNQALQSFGRLAIAGEFSCLMAAVIFLPSLLHVIGAHVAGQSRPPFVFPPANTTAGRS